MEKSFALSLWLGAALYAAVGLVGVVAFHQSTPGLQNLTGGYGIAYSTLASSENVR